MIYLKCKHAIWRITNIFTFLTVDYVFIEYIYIYIYIYILATKVNTCAQMMAHLHGGATTWTKVCTTPLYTHWSMRCYVCYLELFTSSGCSTSSKPGQHGIDLVIECTLNMHMEKNTTAGRKVSLS